MVFHGLLKIRTDILPFVGLKTRPIIFCIIYFKRDTFSCIIDTVIVQKNLIYFPIIGIAFHTSDNFYSKSKDKMNSIETRIQHTITRMFLSCADKSILVLSEEAKEEDSRNEAATEEADATSSEERRLRVDSEQ